ncbi:MAG TPA: DUF2325 domain-containing protein [Polyangiaceae bacterium]|nr:DUF2325 domain-containing protein [Polyangiaceae bacterium]
MHIGLIGGVERGTHHYETLAAEGGHTVEIHSGHLAGRGVDTLTAIVERADVVVIITDVNSHGGMWAAKRLAKARGRRCMLVRRMGPSRFRALVGELGNRTAAAAAVH